MAQSYCTGGSAWGEEEDGSCDRRVASHRIAVVPNRSGLLIICIHGSHERAPSDRLATTFHTIVPTRSARDTFVYSHR